MYYPPGMAILHPASATGVIVLHDIVRLCVCYHSTGRADRRTDLNVGQVGQVEEYLGQVQRSRLPGQKSVSDVFSAVLKTLAVIQHHT